MLNNILRMGTAIFILFLSLYCGRNDTSSTNDTRSFDASKSDSSAIEVVDEMWQALGGREAWAKARYLSYRWIVEREDSVLADYRHDWDRYTGRYRAEGTNRDGNHFVALFNVQSRQGDVYLDGVELPDDSTKANMLERAYARFINDSYWLLMPYKLNDPGVILSYDREQEIQNKGYDVVKVTFEQVGLTPDDTYRAFINKQDRLMHKWEYVLQGQEPDAEPTVAWWMDWQEFDGIKLALDRQFEDRSIRIYFKDVTVSSTVDEDVFQLTERTF
ncbi:hypothetical protein GWO43_30540 [candidate division KSB1 bacterium]|nr:hypothetical protein [candidate division KSB1 bacterium]NIR72933.1 hypothetical protein [candidate division KSB1 bacterium]NIS28232.1 hypothetical protein [candidate division KSB1 bacterium]NIT75121.1 hypothetical protein [candidate division KSB1 bacterium]NIU28909.1 hypothetical protein [candidate division KSB1 bacterium]